jgi:hypothetical protein
MVQEEGTDRMDLNEQQWAILQVSQLWGAGSKADTFRPAGSIRFALSIMPHTHIVDGCC